MNRKIPNRPHPTPDPEKTHSAARTGWIGLARSILGVPGSSEPLASPLSDPESEEPSYDSCFDDLNVELSQSMQQPDPDPNLEPAAERPRQPDGADLEIGPSLGRGSKAPRTSEIFRSVIVRGDDTPAATDLPSLVGVPDEPAGEAMPDLGVLDRATGSTDAHVAGDRHSEGNIPWGQIVLLSYASILTLVLIWLFSTGRIPPAAAPEPPPAEKTATESPARAAQPTPDAAPPPLPVENIASLGQRIRLGNLEVTPMSVEACPVYLVRTIDSNAQRREDHCLVLRLELRNLSKDQTVSPLDRNLVRDRELRAFDPYIATSEGRNIRLFPLALDSEWSISGQIFPILEPGESARTFIAAEPGSANRLAAEMTWRVRLRIGVYRSDMLGVKFTSSQVRRSADGAWDLEE